MSLCLLAGAKLTMIAASTFTLSWTHSVQKTAWEEDWRVTPAGLELLEARVEGSGAGMEAGEGARFDGGWWRWRPTSAPQQRLVLARSGAGGAWRLCSTEGCLELEGGPDVPPAVLTGCAP